MASTAKGIFYPTSSDNIAPLETHFANLANTSDNVAVISGTTAFTGPAATAGTVTVNVTFSTAFATAPKVITAVRGGSTAYISNVTTTPTTTGFTALIYKASGSSSESLTLDWFASTYA